MLHAQTPGPCLACLVLRYWRANALDFPNDGFMDDQPQLIHTPNGCLAVTPPGSTLHVGVFGGDADDATARFAVAVAAWERLATLPEETADAIEAAA